MAVCLSDGTVTTTPGWPWPFRSTTRPATEPMLGASVTTMFSVCLAAIFKAPSKGW
ncbi:hypothetical protein D3C86_2023450 [compost metagenome]